MEEEEGDQSSVEEFTYEEWKKRQKEIQEKIDNSNPVHEAVDNLSYGIRFNHRLIEEVKNSVENIEDKVKDTGITRKDVKLWLMIVSSILIPLLLKVWW